jgi:endoglucanase
VLSRGANINPILYAHLLHTAKKRKIPVQIVADGRATPTDADPMQISRAGVAAALVSIPLRYMHTPGEIISVDDLDRTVELIAHAVAGMKPGQRWIPF